MITYLIALKFPLIHKLYAAVIQPIRPIKE